MPRTLVAIVAVTLAIALPAHADGTARSVMRGPLPAANLADNSFDVSRASLLSSRRETAWLGALSRKLESNRTALEQSRLVVTPRDAAPRTYGYADLLQAANPPRAASDEASGTDDESAGRVRLDLPEKPNYDGDLKVRITGGADAVGVLLSKKM